MTDSDKVTSKVVWVMIIAFFLIISCYHLLAAKAGYPAFRDQHLGTAIEYARNGIDFFHPKIIGFNANDIATPLEIPIWQSAAAIALRLGNGWVGMANVVSLLFLLLGCFSLFMLTKELYNANIARWALLAWIAQPLVFMYLGGRACTDGAASALTILFLWLAIKALRTAKTPWIISACVLGAVSATMKMPFFFFAGVFLFLFVIAEGKKEIKYWIVLFCIGVFSAVVFFAWMHHCNTLIEKAEFALCDTRISNPAMVKFYFGDLAFRFSAGNIFRTLWRFIGCTCGSFALLPLIFAPLVFRREAIFARLMLLAGVATMLVFTGLVYPHYHYFFIFSLTVAISAGLGLDMLQSHNQSRVYRNSLLGVVGCVVVLAFLQGYVGLNYHFQFDPYQKNMVRIIQKYTEPDDKLLISGSAWGLYLVSSGRRGLLEDSSISRKIKEMGGLEKCSAMGFSKIVQVSESPIQYAAKITKPGGCSLKRDVYHLEADVTNRCEIVYRDENICIMNIPKEARK